MLRKILTSALVCLISAGVAFAQTGSLTGTITDAETGEPLVGANVYFPELQQGSPTDGNGQYEVAGIPEGTYDVRISYIGYTEKTQSVEITSGETELNVELSSGMALSELVVTGIGGDINRNAVTFSSQEVNAEQLNVTQDANIKTSLAGKVAGVQILGQAGSKLGESGDIRIRGAISLTSALSEPLFVVDGVPGVDPNIIDMNNVEDVNVLKGPNATALYGQRGANGVVVISTAAKGAAGVSVELNNSLTFQDVAYLPEFQNQYGQGYNGEGEWQTFNFDANRDPAYFEPLDGSQYLFNSYADESWGPELDGDQYAAWYNWFPDSPYYGENATWEPNPGNVENFYETGVTNKANFVVNYTQDDYTARVSYSNLNQSGIIPGSNINKHYIGGTFDYDVTEAFQVGINVNYTLQALEGDVLSDGYANQTSGTFNQWFGRQVSVKKMKELQNLRTPEGFQTNWNWWGPISALGPAYGSTVAQNGLKKPAFWFNSYTWMDNYVLQRDTDNLLVNVDLSYQLSDNWEVTGKANRSTYDYGFREELPYTFQQSSDQSGQLYNHYVNAFGQAKTERSENNYQADVNYQNNFDDWTVDIIGGSQVRVQDYSYLASRMDIGNYQSGGLIIPNVYSFSNSREQIVPTESNWDKRVYSLYARANVGYQDMIYINGSYRQDWSSALPSGDNGYGYPSIGASFVFTELLENDILTYGKIRAGWAQVGSDVGAETILGSYRLSSDPYTNPINGTTTPLSYTDSDRIDPNIKPAINSSYEAGLDLRFLANRIGLSATYYNEFRRDDIIGVDVSSATGTTSFITNAGEVQRQGIEIAIDGTPVQTQSFQWNTALNFAHNYTVVNELPQGLETYTIGGTQSTFGFTNIVHELDKEWGQLRGPAIDRNDQGQPIVNANGLFAVEQNHNYGSVLPDFTGGFLNTLTYKGLSLQASIDFQKGGQFFSLSEQWAKSGGMLAETADNNDLGNEKRAPILDEDGNLLPEDVRGGVHVTGVDADGNPVDTYVNAQSYYSQFNSNSLGEPFIHDASYIKLREMNLSYSLPQQWLGGFVNTARIGVVARNLWMIALADGNIHGWDPSELSQTYGENGQLPGTRSYGFNINVTF